jgi:hypothetical protein
VIDRIVLLQHRFRSFRRLVVTLLQQGFAATVASALGLLSGTALASIIAGIMLFVWNFFSAQANLYIELKQEQRRVR